MLKTKTPITKIKIKNMEASSMSALLVNPRTSRSANQPHSTSAA
jgi:hypothetical protein